ncbi:tyrosine-type recombinase/integrase [Clostridium sp. FP2]|uniref:tyrosine-type recombinase/integrase n=1 Tax=Clostridium sp. FP2 TaxID=2724481 RepID=UPI0013E98E58|nr:tyrosine-type recombinase/integrase [Clostridium sp. FP2]MBZ9622896.1 tyrosine-type recombinase/integrase [Clostridium sp. FP2]
MLLIDEYKDYLHGVEGKSAGTVEQYYSSVHLFMQYMKKSEFSITRQSIIKVKLSNIYGFINSLTESNSNGTRRNKISALKSFFEYCKEIELLKHNIIVDLKKQPKKNKRIAKYFTLEECKRLVNSVGGRNKERDKMMIILFLNTGIRLAELVSLNISCIDNENLNIVGKGNKERVIHLDSSIIDLLKEYIKTTRADSGIEVDALFLSERLTRVSSDSVQSAVNKAIANAGLNTEGKNDVSVHVLRHTFATLQFQNGVSIRTLQKILGHEDISTTQIYVQVADNQMIEAAKTNPLKSIY